MKTSNSVVSIITNKTWNLHAVCPVFISYIVGRLKERDHVPEKRFLKLITLWNSFPLQKQNYYSHFMVHIHRLDVCQTPSFHTQ